jgi:hypothetical protein
MNTRIALAISAGAIWLLSSAPARAQATTEYLGTTGQSAGQEMGQSLGSAIGNQFNQQGQAVDSGDTTPSDDSNGQDQGQTLDSGGDSGTSQGPAGDDDNSN